MAQGVPTEESVIAEFRARYLYSGNASRCARDLKISETTGRELARGLSKDSAFAEERRALRAQALEELVAMRQRVAETAAERFADELEYPEPIENGPPITVIDKRPDYAKVVLDAEKNAQNLARFDAERDGLIQAPGTVNITVGPTPAAAQRIANEDEKPGDGSAGA